MLSAHDIRATASKLRKNSRGRALAAFDCCSVGVARFSAHPRWERHPAGGEFLQVFEGELDLTLLTADGPIETTLRPGSVFVVPRGLWHSPRPRGAVTLLYISNTEGTEISNERDPRIPN
ncbi:cupin domain-containing protein [Candidatus Binatus sp.]|uniref:cupin domain-containing protein n=1 Tax=Candidatus Binatus sp. TaxID=2811406 RepID=UPI00351CE4E8